MTEQKQKKAVKPQRHVKKKAETTSWGGVAHWYDTLLAGDDTYQTQVILPNLLRAMAIKKGDTVLDLGCGQGFFSRAFFNEGAVVTGVDLSKELIAIAKKSSPQEVSFSASSAEDLSRFADNSFSKIAIVLAVQNMEAPHKVFKECMRVLKPGSSMFIVVNHPAFRVPKDSDWGYDEIKKVQYRRTDRYLSESKVIIEMNPGKTNGATTVSFHRPLQYFFKTLANSRFLVARLEEWISHKESEKGPRQAAENQARKEIPLFMMIEAVKR